MINNKIRIIAYERSKNNYYYFELSPGSTIEEARDKVVEWQSKYGVAYIETYENEEWEKYE
ncbi:hypothetical protein [Pelosinus fermentans]|jgi:hypothetical protein|uniref:Uncharacterized protein n=1 Tax=Pelosinus fermentans JBW45 TaxID=1192197 RepID=I8TY13_9FIRM|nr:hypothetical protein [Pelosinus fermentans]AJQ30032.1 hypothetical protein JBW_04703 [Pelosinus fermentans JBW45]